MAARKGGKKCEGKKHKKKKTRNTKGGFVSKTPPPPHFRDSQKNRNALPIGKSKEKNFETSKQHHRRTRSGGKNVMRNLERKSKQGRESGCENKTLTGPAEPERPLPSIGKNAWGGWNC